MKTISIIVPETAILAGVADPRYLFTTVNDHFRNPGNAPSFKIQLVGLTKEVTLNNGAFTIHTDALIQEVVKTDLIIIPPLSGNMTAAIKLNKDFIPWITHHYKEGAEVASLCIGTFLLASTGLLKGKKCSTHWAYANEFRNMFPDVDLVDGRIISEDNGIYSSGGATSYWNLLLYLIERYTNREITIFAAKYFALEIDRISQSPFIIFKGQREHDDEIIKQVQNHIEENCHDKIPVDHLAEKYNIGRRSLERRFKKATNNTLIEYIQRVKIETAKKQLEIGRKTVNEVMYGTGYTDTKAFRDVFKKVTGMSPLDYRNKYNKEMYSE